ncbi:MAG TPA: hypothetical protein VIY68_04400 [Steroidobacteraceae bacterium]
MGGSIAAGGVGEATTTFGWLPGGLLVTPATDTSVIGLAPASPNRLAFVVVSCILVRDLSGTLFLRLGSKTMPHAMTAAMPARERRRHIIGRWLSESYSPASNVALRDN